MTRILYRVLFVLFLFAGLRSSAQTSSDVAVWIVDSKLSSSTVVDDGDELKFDFEESAGYGLSFNHFWTDRFSTELALQKYGADMTISSLGVSLEVGELSITSLTAIGEWHFNRGGRFSPYVGGGIAHIGGDFEFADNVLEPGDDGDVDLKADITWTAAAGANVNLTPHLSLTGELKYIPWSAREENDLLEDAIEVDPVTFAAGLRWRF
jgi:outer membrane protein W